MDNPDVTIGQGSMSGKGLYAARDFKKGELITVDARHDDVPVR